MGEGKLRLFYNINDKTEIEIIKDVGKQLKCEELSPENYCWIISEMGHEKTRYLMPCPNEIETVDGEKESLKELFIKTSGLEKILDQFLIFDQDSVCTNLIISPFRKADKLPNKEVSEHEECDYLTESLIGYVNKNRQYKDKDIDEKKIKHKYIKFINWLIKDKEKNNEKK